MRKRPRAYANSFFFYIGKWSYVYVHPPQMSLFRKPGADQHLLDSSKNEYGTEALDFVQVPELEA